MFGDEDVCGGVKWLSRTRGCIDGGEMMRVGGLVAEEIDGRFERGKLSLRWSE